MKVFGIEFRADEGVRFFADGEIGTLRTTNNCGDKAVLLLPPPINQNDMIKQINDAKESGGKQPYQQNRIYDSSGDVPALPAQLNSGSHIIQVNSATKCGYEEAKEGDSINFSVPNSKTRRGRVGVGVAQTLDTQVNQSVIVASRGRGENNEQRLEANTTNTTNTLTGVTKDNMLMQGVSIRRLTEIECERLQGFSDNWTKYGNYDGVVKEISRTQRYKMIGNAVTSDIVELIGRKMLNHITE